MNRILSTAVVVLVMLSSIVFMTADELQAEDDYVQEEIFHCYGDHPTLRPMYEVNDLEDIRWECSIDGVMEDNGDGTVTIDLTDISNSGVVVTQTVGSETAKVTLIPHHINDDADQQHHITFWNEGNTHSTYTIHGGTVVKQGEPFVVTPADPVRDGFAFAGWFTDRSFSDESRFDPFDPVDSDVNVYAKWVAGTSGGSTVVMVKTHTVTFQTQNGLEYAVVSNVNNSVTFTVSVVDGYELNGEISVTSDGGRISGSDGMYTLSGVDRDIVVTITGDVTNVDRNGNQENGGFPWWILVVIIVILVVLFVAYYYHSKRSQDQSL